MAASSVCTISSARCDAGNTHSSVCVTSSTPSRSNHAIVSSWPNSRSKRFISRWPRGYTASRLLTPANELVRLQRPPPVSATLASGFFIRSNTWMSASGSLRAVSIAAKQPAAPAPTIATRLCVIISRRYLQITTTLSAFTLAFRKASSRLRSSAPVFLLPAASTMAAT